MNADRKLTITGTPSIVLDGVFFQFRDPSGIARVWSALLKEWSGTQFGQSLLVLDRDGAVPKFPGINYIDFKSFKSGLAATESFVLEQLCRRHKANLFVSTFYTTPLETPSVAMVHDVITERFPGNELKWCVEKRFGVYHASGYIAVSHRTARDLHEEYPTSGGAPLCITHNGVNSCFRPVPPNIVQAFRTRFAVHKPYFLCVGRRNGHKNGQLFFTAFSRLPDKHGISIVCCGGHQTLEPEFRACVEGTEAHMLSLSDDDLNAAYAGALALVYPSLYEGFGLPIVEAMAAGCPVITCPNASIPEVAGEAALYVDDCDADGMLRGLSEIQKRETREPLIQAGFQRSKLFSWSESADTVGTFLTAMARRNGLPSDVRGASSRRRWRELRSFESQFDGASRRLRELLRRPELKGHMLQCGETSERLQELESAWLESIKEENATLGGG